MEGPAFWTAAVIAAMLVGMGKGGLPAVAMLSVPLLSLVISPVAAAGLLLPVYVLSDMFGIYAYRRSFDRRVLAIMAAGGTVGVTLGWATAHLVTEDDVKLLVGIIGTAFVANLMLKRGREVPARPARVGPGLFWGTVAGFTSFVSHSGGPPYQVYVLPLKLTKATFAGTTTIFFAYVNAIKLIPYWALGQINTESLEVAAFLTVPAVAAVFIGFHLVKILPEKAFFRFVTLALLAVSLKLIWDVLG